MTDPDTASSAPAYKEPGFVCPHCARFAHQDWTQLLVNLGLSINEFYDGPRQTASSSSSSSGSKRITGEAPLPAGQGWWAAKCFSCKRSSVWRGRRMIHPSASTAPQAHPDMPEDARELYDEARAVLAVSQRAGAALARATLERLLRSLDPEAGKVDLASRIERIMPKVSSSLAQMLTVVRHVGNKSLHVEDDPDEATVLVLSDEQAEVSGLLFESINALVDELVTKKKVAEAIYSKLPAGVRAKVEAALAEKAKD